MELVRPAGLRISVLMIVAALEQVTAESHFDTYTYSTLERRQNCRDIQSRSCSSFLWWGSCRSRTERVCNDYYESVARVGKKCQTGWRDYPGKCDIPICSSPACSGGKVCISPEYCGCLTTQGECSSVGCSDTKNCYPGTCKSGRCECPPGFSGENCQTVEMRPDIKDCKMTLFTGNPETSATTVNCGTSGQTLEPVWSNVTQPGRVLLQWRVEFNSVFNVPDRNTAPHVANSPVKFGVTKSSFRYEREFDCSIQTGSNGNPKDFADCSISKNWVDLTPINPRHGQSMNLSVEAQVGGYKIGQNSGIPHSSFSRQEFTGEPQTAQLKLTFDLQPPVHCLTGKTTPAVAKESCSKFPIHVEFDVSTNPKFDIYLYNWTDADSGVAGYHIEVYFMQPGTDTYLRNTGSPIIVGDVTPTSDISVYTFILPKSGVYAVELTVSDKAGNQAKARKIILHDQQSMIKINKDKPIRLLQSDPSTVGEWLTSYETPRDGGSISLTLDWTGHFTSNGQYGNGWANAVSSWSESGAIDDRFGDVYGLRSIEAMKISDTGIVVYNLAYVIDKHGGIGLTYSNRSWTSLNATKENFELQIAGLTDGDSIVIWLNANDVTGSGNGLVERIIIPVDKSRPVISNATFQLKSEDEFTSSVYIAVVDEHSGIKNIRFKIYDKTIGDVPVYNGTASPTLRDSPDESNKRRKRASSILHPCTIDDKSCYCSPQGICYSRIQEIRINHCWIDRLAGHSFIVRYVVVNSANLETSVKEIDLKELSDIPCRPDKLSGGIVAIIVIGILVGVAVLVALIVLIVTVLRVKVYHKPTPEFVKRFQSISFSKTHENEVYLSSDVLQNAARSGGRTGAGSRAVNAGPVQARANDQHVYNDYSSPPAYSSGDSVRDRQRGEHSGDEVYNNVPKSDLKYEQEIGKGRFAVIFKVRLLRAHSKDAVAAAKKLRSGHDAEDVEVLKRKINFLKHMVPPHPNIVRYVGDTEEDKTGNPVLLLEYCEINLLDWLKGQTEINDEISGQLITIALNIARGMEHLHKNNIIHSRLAARNVLINKSGTYGEIVAKLIGFGPMSEKGMEKTPKEWFAPETIESFNQQPIYNKKTDSWSYGIVLCELFNGGETPYKEIARNQLLNHLKSGKRMKRPNEMPQELYEDVCKPCWDSQPNRRPEFSEICQSVINYRDGAEQPLYRPVDYDNSQEIYADAG